jgi:hypothetical protein
MNRRWVQHLLSRVLPNSGFDVPQMVPPGHFYSPIVNPKEIAGYLDQVHTGVLNQCVGIDFNSQEQLKLLQLLAQSAAEWRQKEPTISGGPRYLADNDQFGIGDAVCYAAMIGSCKPSRIIEIGSGWSSALALDATEVFGLSIDHTFVEPFPERLNRTLRSEDRSRVTIHETFVQQLPLSVFAALKRNDVLFIDSTHVCKPGSDVQYLLNEVLPRLSDGVLVHIHDMFFPFEYPEDWITEGRNWNELHLVRMLLQFSQRYTMRFWNHYLTQVHRDIAASAIPELKTNSGGGLWLSVNGS